MKICMLIGLICSVIGSILTGFISQGGIPKRGETIKAPKRNVALAGWGLILIGFIIQTFATIFS